MTDSRDVIISVKNLVYDNYVPPDKVMLYCSHHSMT